MQVFLNWFNAEQALDPVLKSALAHLWFVTIHPFDDGNGRTALALVDLQLAGDDNDSRRFYSLSAQIKNRRKAYYNILESTQRGDCDITNWMLWYLECMSKALESTEQKMKRFLRTNKFWDNHQQLELNNRQRKMIDKLFDGLDGKLTSSKWAKMTKCSTDTALRDIQDLLHKKILKKEAGGGRSTAYNLR